MTNYNELIKKNAEEFKDAEQLTDFLDAYITDDKEVSAQEDNIAEYADGLVPIYYHDIVEEWRTNVFCQGLTKEIAGEYDAGGDIHKMMQSDLFYWYEQRLREDFDKLLEFINDAEDEPETEPEV